MGIKGARVVAIVAVVVPTVLIAGAGTAAADEGRAWGSVVGGRERIRFYVNASARCNTETVVSINGQVVLTDSIHQRFGRGQILPAPVGTPWVKVVARCGPGSWNEDTLDVAVFDGPVVVSPADPTLDALDDFLSATGSSQQRTDPTTR
ncbi:hypothetical protein [Nocardia sp. NPDC052566]|uniref:hypothetical protein n=1 Tax=Nocardia sp. NPDC052566 TaxID=3364330 RepID=UPI0037C8626F